MSSQFEEFLQSDDSLRVYADGQLLFASQSDRLIPLMEYIHKFSPCIQPVTIMDRIAGNAAALLAIKANCHELLSPMGSQHAVTTLENYSIKHHFTAVLPYIKKEGSDNMCPMEKLSLNKTPEEFYQALKLVLERRE